MPSPVIAQAFLVDGGNNMRAIPSSPGRRVEFRANNAVIRDPRDFIACLRHPGVELNVEKDWVEWVAGWMNDCGTALPPQGDPPKLPSPFFVSGEPGKFEVLADTLEEGLIDLPDLPEDDALPSGLSEGVWSPPKHPGGRPKNKPNAGE